ncbi:unnamed protein product, partial [Ectocarpus sp. 12 AP-2014]
MSHSSSGGGRGGEEEPRGGARFGGDEVGTTPAACDTTPAEEHLFHLVEMGYAEDQALAALLDAHGNLDQALDTLSTQTGQSNPAGAAAQLSAASRDDVTAGPLSPAASSVAATGPASGENWPGGGGGRYGGEGSERGETYDGGEGGAAPAASDTIATELLVAHLVEMGYPEDQALAALLDAHGNLDQALDTLSTLTVQDDERKTDASGPLADLQPRDWQDKMKNLPAPVRRDIIELVEKLGGRIDDDARKELVDMITTSVCATMSQDGGDVDPNVLSSEFTSAASAVCQPSQVASVLRGHKWHTGGSSAWSTFKAGGVVLETFKDVTASVSKRARDVFKRLREKMTTGPSAKPAGTTSEKPTDRAESSGQNDGDDSGRRSSKQGDPAADGDHSPVGGTTDQEPGIAAQVEDEDGSSGVLRVDSSAQGGVAFQKNVGATTAENKIDIGAHAQQGEGAINAGNVSAKVGTVSANAEAREGNINAGNVNAQAFDVQASASAQGGDVNVGNVNANAVQVSATANAGAGSVNAGNVNANLLNVNA